MSFLLSYCFFPAHFTARSYYGENYVVYVDEREYKFSDESLKNNLKSVYHEPLYSKTIEDKREISKKLIKMGFNKEEILNYLFPGICDEISKIINENNYEPVNAEVVFDGVNPFIKNEKNGKKLLKNDLIELIFDGFLQNNELSLNIKSSAILADVCFEKLNNIIKLKGFFETPIRGTNQEGRIHNIKQALSKLDGKKIENREKFSFNNAIGNTTKENGYSIAKVIINGKYEDDYGGGVCQAATTLYNALLYAGIDVNSVRGHSLKVGYVEPSFDAMVSYGISDLVFTNNTGEPIYVKTYVDNSCAQVYIYGVNNEFTIKRRSEVLDYDESYPENVNYKSKGYLEYYKDDYLVRTKNIRSDTYYKLTNV